MLKKIAMCPTLLSSAAADGDEDDNSGSSSDDFFRDLGHAFEELKEVDSFSEDWVKMSSSKLVVFDALVSTIVDTTVEKVGEMARSRAQILVRRPHCLQSTTDRRRLHVDPEFDRVRGALQSQRLGNPAPGRIYAYHQAATDH